MSVSKQTKQKKTHRKALQTVISHVDHAAEFSDNAGSL